LTDVAWQALPVALLRMRRLVLVACLAPLVLLALLPGVLVDLPLLAVALVPLALLGAGWSWLGRNWRAWRYALREDDLLITHGVLRQHQLIVPYGRMQLVEVSAGPLLRRFGLASLQLHTAAATTDASLPGLSPADATVLRDQLAELGEARSAGL
jgi:membrane protein YdbS with pleckstrin-like domain